MDDFRSAFFNIFRITGQTGAFHPQSHKMIFEHHLSVRGYELDSYNHVNNAVYLNYMEHARWELLADTGLLAVLKSKGILMVVTEICIRYSKEARLFDKLLIKTGVKIQEPYVIFDQRIFNEATGDKLARAEVKLVCIDNDRLTENIPTEIYQKFSPASTDGSKENG